MEKESEFERLEKYVERLLKNCAGMKAENKRLEYELLEQRSDNTRLRQNIEGLEAEKGEVSTRVGSLIDRIESWESGLADQSERAEIGEAGEQNEDLNSLESAENVEGVEGDERGGGVQTSLFSAESSNG